MTRTHVLIASSLLLFGALYDQAVGWMERTQPRHGHTADQVVFGTTVTVVATAPLIGWRNVGTVLAALACSGVSMWIGSKARHFRALHDERVRCAYTDEIRRQLDQINNGDRSEAVE